MENLLGELRVVVASGHPRLLGLFDVFADEALFARQWLSTSLLTLAPGARVLEVGAGLMLVSCQLVREGFQVSALEPVGDGFSAFLELQQVVLAHAHSQGYAPAVLALPVERLDLVAAFDFAFSVNVMEHIDDVPLALSNIARALAEGGSYRFTCPNYLFPYEPHFNIPTLFSKRLTEYVLGHRIRHSRRVEDQAGLWRSLNWINVLAIERACRPLQGIRVMFDRALLGRTIQRVVSDPAFATRRSGWVRVVARWMVRLRLHGILVHCPAILQPIIDCTVARTQATGAPASGGMRK